jgi:FkbM family methyltransferase
MVKAPFVFQNWWRWPLPKLGMDTVLELRNGLRFFVRGGTTDLAAINESFMFNSYLAAGHIELNEDAIVIDVGANIGDFTMQVAKMCPKGRVYAVEPLADCVAVLRRNLALNYLVNVEILNSALGGHDGETRLFGAGVSSSEHFHIRGTSDSETVRITTLARLINDWQLERIDLLKLDCEGAEWDILPTATEVLPRIRQISMEFHPDRGWTGARLAQFLRESGYAVWYQTNAPWNGLLWARRA